MTDEQAMRESAGGRLALISESYQRITGQALYEGDLWHAPVAILAHDTDQPPRFFFGNKLTLDMFRMTAAQFIGLPSHLSAEPDRREERAAMFAQLEASNLVTNYSGVRIAVDGTRFRIIDAVIWNLLDEHGQRHGQAAVIDRWQPVAA